MLYYHLITYGTRARYLQLAKSMELNCVEVDHYGI
jgi:hypothetical protein